MPKNKILGHYKNTDSGVVFEDGIAYTHRESIIIAKSKPKPCDLKVLHTIKGVFDGEIEAFDILHNPKGIVEAKRKFRIKDYSKIDPDHKARMHKFINRNKADCEQMTLQL